MSEKTHDFEDFFDTSEEYTYKGFTATLGELLEAYNQNVNHNVLETIEELVEDDDVDIEKVKDDILESLTGDVIAELREQNPKRVLKNLEPEEYEAYLYCAVEVEKRQNYGRRKEEAEQLSTRLRWSNGAASWFACREIETGEMVDLDANEILAPCKKETAEKFADFLPELPLYSLSTEAKVRGEASPHATLQWALKQLDRRAIGVEEELKEELEKKIAN